MRRRKPDLMVVLAVVIGMGVLVTGLVEGSVNKDKPTQLSNTAYQQQR